MADLTGIFVRGSSYYLRVVLPASHPATARYRSGKVVLSLGACGRREAVARGTVLRAEVLRGNLPTLERVSERHAASTSAVLAARAIGAAIAADRPVSQGTQPPFLASAMLAATPVYLRDVYGKWADAKPRSADTLAACRRALELYELQTGNPPITQLTRAAGVDFRAWLQSPARGTTPKTARDRLTWVKSLLKHAHVDLELMARSPWEGLDIEQTTTYKRRPWSIEELNALFSAPLHHSCQPPGDRRAGGLAAYWIPLLGLFTGARISELVQLRKCDVETVAGVPVISITDEGSGQQVKTSASARKVPIHSELLRLGFLEYVNALAGHADNRLWPKVPQRDGKNGGFFSQWFGEYRRSLGFDRYPDFHCFRHTIRTALADAEVAEPMIDTLLGHEISGSTGARQYTHRTLSQMRVAIEKVRYPGLGLRRVYGIG